MCITERAVVSQDAMQDIIAFIGLKNYRVRASAVPFLHANERRKSVLMILWVMTGYRDHHDGLLSNTTPRGTTEQRAIQRDEYNHDKYRQRSGKKVKYLRAELHFELVYEGVSATWDMHNNE